MLPQLQLTGLVAFRAGWPAALSDLAPRASAASWIRGDIYIYVPSKIKMRRAKLPASSSLMPNSWHHAPAAARRLGEGGGLRHR
jgi:hypothetical protein